jgi:hypothetical protein
MRLTTKLTLLLAALSCLAGVSAIPASAAPERVDEGAVGGFELKGTNGNRILVLAEAPPGAGGKGEVLLVVGRKGSAALYDAPATVTPTLAPETIEPSLNGLATSIQADLGPLGKIAVELKPSGTTETDRSRCGKPLTHAAGTYEGAIEFHGEEGFTDATATAVPLSLRALVALACVQNGPSEARGGKLPGAALTATSRTAEGHLALQVNQNRPGARVALSATLSENRGGIKIRREVAAMAPGSAFTFDPKLLTASLNPPSPFSGTATFRRSAAPANRFSGSLTVDFPGNSNISLTAGAHAHLVHAKLGKNAEGVLHPEPRIDARPLLAAFSRLR